MSCNYAEGLSAYENKGVLGVPEVFDDPTDVRQKCEKLAEWLQQSKHVVVHTGAGISTAAGIPDFRGPKGVWTLEKRGEKPNVDISFNDAVPTKTHMALRTLLELGYVHFIVSQNIDGLHMKSGLARQHLAELHGNMFVDQCNKCKKQFVRSNAAATVGQKPSGQMCQGDINSTRSCRGGILQDNILDWEGDLPDRDLELALMHSTLADLNITLGTTLQIVPSGNLPLKNKRYGGKVVICNLQPTKHDKKADLLISTYVDDILTKVCKRLGVEIPSYRAIDDPTKQLQESRANVEKCGGLRPTLARICLEWTLSAFTVKELEKLYSLKLKEAAAFRKRDKDKRNTNLEHPKISIKKQHIQEELKNEDKVKVKKE